MGKLLGIATIKVDGKELMSKEGAKLGLGGISRTTVVGNKVHGFSEKQTPGFVECSITVDQLTDLSAMAKWDNVTVMFQTDVGQTYVLRNAWLTSPPEMTASDGGGDVPLRFEGPPVEALQ